MCAPVEILARMLIYDVLHDPCDRMDPIGPHRYVQLRIKTGANALPGDFDWCFSLGFLVCASGLDRTFRKSLAEGISIQSIVIGRSISIASKPKQILFSHSISFAIPSAARHYVVRRLSHGCLRSLA